MINAYAVLPPQQAPHGEKDQLVQLLADAGVTGADVTLLSATSAAYVFSISAEDGESNQTILTGLCGTLNIAQPPAQDAQARGVAPFRVGGTWEGRFAQENKPK